MLEEILIEKAGLNLSERLAGWDWQPLLKSLDQEGYVRLPALFTAQECQKLVELYSLDHLFRSRISMEQYRFGQGEYKYFDYELPDLVQEVRTSLYPYLTEVANGWSEKLKQSVVYPVSLSNFLADCHRAGQPKPTPLILRYEAGGYNCLHQDLYGEIAFPLQVVFVLNQRGQDYDGGELLLVEQRPRAQSVGQVITLERGEGLIFTNRYRPLPSSRGYYRANVRHGVSRLQWGERYSLGLIFHDAR